MPGLSKDPAKRARQIAGLAKTNTVVAERLAAGHYDLPPEPETAPPVPVSPAPASPVGPAEIAGVPIQQRSTHAPQHDRGPRDDVPPGPAREHVEHPPADEPEPERRAGGFLSAFREGFFEG